MLLQQTLFDFEYLTIIYWNHIVFQICPINIRVKFTELKWLLTFTNSSLLLTNYFCRNCQMRILYLLCCLSGEFDRGLGLDKSFSGPRWVQQTWGQNWSLLSKEGQGSKQQKSFRQGHWTICCSRGNLQSTRNVLYRHDELRCSSSASKHLKIHFYQDFVNLDWSLGKCLG